MARRRKGYAAIVRELESGSDLEQNIEQTYEQEEMPKIKPTRLKMPKPKYKKEGRLLAKTLVNNRLRGLAYRPSDKKAMQAILRRRRRERRRG